MINNFFKTIFYFMIKLMQIIELEIRIILNKYERNHCAPGNQAYV